MAVVKKTILFFWGFCFFCSSWVFAEELVLDDLVRQLEKRIQALEERVSRQEEYIAAQNITVQEQKQKISEYEIRFSQFDEKLHRQTGSPVELSKDFEIGVGATMIIQGTNNVNDATADVQKKVSGTDASYSVDVTVGKEFNGGGQAFLHLEAGEGAGLEDSLALYSNVNRDADNDNNVRLTELWYEQALFQDKTLLTFGKLDPTAYFDNSEVANDETTQFLGRIFRNSPTVEFPDNSAGMRLAYLPIEWLELNYGLFDANSDWEKIGDNLFNIGQVIFKTDFFNLCGNYRFLGWNSNVYHTRWLDETEVKEAAYGFGLSFDQKFNDIAAFFCRYAWQNPGVYNPDIKATGELNYSLEHSWSAGFQIEGRPWGRDKDVFAFAVGQIFPSDDYKKAGESQEPVRLAKTEGHLETYYRIQVNEHFSVTPDFQYIWNVFGKDVADDTNGIFVSGVRVQVDF